VHANNLCRWVAIWAGELLIVKIIVESNPTPNTLGKDDEFVDTLSMCRLRKYLVLGMEDNSHVPLVTHVPASESPSDGVQALIGTDYRKFVLNSLVRKGRTEGKRNLCSSLYPTGETSTVHYYIRIFAPSASSQASVFPSQRISIIWSAKQNGQYVRTIQMQVLKWAPWPSFSRC
jgi:hypothetical protein